MKTVYVISSDLKIISLIKKIVKNLFFNDFVIEHIQPKNHTIDIKKRLASSDGVIIDYSKQSFQYNELGVFALTHQKYLLALYPLEREYESDTLIENIVEQLPINNPTTHTWNILQKTIHLIFFTKSL